MNKFKAMKLGTKLTLQVVSIILAVLTASFILIISITAANNESNSKYQVTALAEEDAATVKAELESALDTARTLAQSMQGFNDLEAENRRSTYNSLLKSVLENNTKYLGVWTCWEPNAIDGMDVKYQNTSDSDSSGRFIPYWRRSGNVIALEPLVDYAVQGAGDYYLLAKNLAKETILDPFKYEISGKEILMTSVVVPIKDKSGVVVGAAGVDLSLADLQTIKFDQGGYKSSFVNVISNSGLFVYHLDSETVGKNISDIRKESHSLAEQIDAIKSGRSYTTQDSFEASGKSSTRYFVPIKIGQTTTPWSVEVVVETDEIMASTYQMTYLLIGVLVLLLIIIVLALILIVKKSISNPLKKALNMMQEMSKGHLKNRLNMKSMDEVGMMAQAMDSFADDLQKDVVNVVQKIALGDVNMTITPYDEEDEIRPALKSTVETMQNLLSETNGLIEASVNGDLSTRAQADKFDGGWKDLVGGINNILDAVIAPVQEAADVLAEMAKGNLQSRVEGNYRGDHAKIKDALNSTLDSLSAYVFEISNTLNEMANSNLELEIKNEYLGDFAQIKEALNSIILNMNAVLQDISTAADQVASASSQVSAGSQAQSQGATEQASSIEELTASIEQVAAQTNQNAENADEANRLGANAREDAITGNEHMQKMLQSMEEINESSASISKIIKVIDDIAFQTNILALNAAVEAARAGQYGKGFAVVAEEVRNLASRSAQAAKETTGLIEESISKASAGTKIANDTAESLKKIVDGVSRASTLVGSIASASKEQASAITQINRAIMQVSDVIQSSSATAEEGAAASEELSSQAETLKTMLKNFKLKKSKYALRNEEITPEMLKMLKGLMQKESARTMVVDLDTEGNLSEPGELKNSIAAQNVKDYKKDSTAKKPKIKIDLNENEDSKY